MKKIVLSIGDYTGKGGIERAFTLLANAIAAENQDICLLNWQIPSNKPTFHVDSNVKIDALNAKGFELQRIKSNLIRKVLNVYSIPYFILANRQKTKKYIFQHQPDYVICTDVKTAFFWFINNPSKKTKIITTEQFNFNESGRLFCLIKRLFFQYIHAVVLLNDEEKEVYTKIGANVVIIPNLSNINETIHPNTAEPSKRIISAGRLMPQKGYDLLIEAWKILGNKTIGWQLDIFGEGRELEYLKQLSASCHNISFKGFSRNLDKEFETSAFYIMSSRYEGLGMVLIEALDKCLPCISFACPTGPKTIIKNGVNGFLAEPENVSDLALQIEKLIANPQLLVKMRENAPHTINQYRPQNIILKWKELLKFDESKAITPA